MDRVEITTCIEVIQEQWSESRWKPPIPQIAALALIDEEIRQAEGKVQWLKRQRTIVAESKWVPR